MSLQNTAARIELNELADVNDIICLQETWLSVQDSCLINSLNQSMIGIANSPNNDEHGFQSGRRKEGVALLFKKELEPYIVPLLFKETWIVGIAITWNGRKLCLLNVYLPYESRNNEEEYLDRLGKLHAIIEELDTSSVTVVGDFNANISNPESIFSQHLNHFCELHDYLCSSRSFLPDTTYTYVSDAWGTTSWLDHCISTQDAHSAISGMDVSYGFVQSDHIPLVLELDISLVPCIDEGVNNSTTRKIDWTKVKPHLLDRYHYFTDEHLKSILLPVESFMCEDTMCSDSNHILAIEQYYDEIVKVLINCSNMTVARVPKKVNNVRPGWNVYVADLHQVARQAFLTWRTAGSPRNGQLFLIKNRTRARFKSALRFIKRNEDRLRKDSVAKKLLSKNFQEFWNEIKFMNNSKMSLPNTIDGVSGNDNIVKLWKNHYHEIFNCLNSRQDMNLLAGKNLTFCDELKIKPGQVSESINSLDNNKSCAFDGLCAEHLKFSSARLLPMLSMCFNSMIVHGFLPDSLINVVLVPVIKNKSAGICDKNNYRPIALASVMSKLLEKLLYCRIINYLKTHSNQFGFKAKHGTDMCIYALKEAILRYQDAGSNVFSCFLDASKAFDRVNHNILFTKLLCRGVPPIIVRLISYWYTNQTMSVRWKGLYSDKFTVSNGVRQGGILSPYLFCVYVDDLSFELNKLPIGCMLGESKINHLMYADDLVLISPTAKGLVKLLNICNEFGVTHDIRYNSKKSSVIVFGDQGKLRNFWKAFSIGDEIIPVNDKYKYLGQVLTSDLKDNSDINRQIKLFYAQGNILARKFYMCSDEVKKMLFRSYCNSPYGCHLWWRYNQETMRRLTVSFNNAFRILCNEPRWCSASYMFVSRNLPTLKIVIRKLVYSFISRLWSSTNSILSSIVSSDIPLRSYSWHCWFGQLLLTV